MIRSYPWKHHDRNIGDFSDQAVRQLRSNFDPRTSLGNNALGLLLVETYFPESSVKVAEILKDQMRCAALNRMGYQRSHHTRMEMAAEILSHEGLRTILVIDGNQFDSKSILIRHPIQHPLIAQFPAWEAITASLVVDEALATSNPVAEGIHLQRAEIICPGMHMVNLCRMMNAIKLDDKRTLADLFETFRQHRNAAVLFVAWKYLDSAEHERILKDIYPPEVIELLEIKFARIKEGMAISKVCSSVA